MVDSLKYIEWYRKGEADLKGAEILFEYGGDNGIIAFHCQQAIEKTLKGFLIQESGRLSNGHSLLFLLKEASQFEEQFIRFRKDCAFVNQFYIETRYPADESLDLSQDEALECIKIAKKLIIKVKEIEKERFEVKQPEITL